jgi:FtsH-binding integral membrane protein
MSRVLAVGLVGVLIAELVGMMVGWPWALPAAGVGVLVFALQIRGNLAGVRRPAAEEPAQDAALESLHPWK